MQKKLYIHLANGNNFYLELKIPHIYNNFFYKIYGSEGFCNYGRYSSFINLHNIEKNTRKDFNNNH